MSEAPRHIPFPDVRWGLLEEIDSPMPTAQNSLLFDGTERAIMSDPRIMTLLDSDRLVLPSDLISEAQAFLLVARWGAESSSGKRQVAEDIRSYIRAEFPGNHDQISDIIHTQVDSDPQKKRQNYRLLAQEAGVAIQAPSGTKVEFHFGPHQYNATLSPLTPEQHAESLRTNLEKLFDKKGRNVFFQETASKANFSYANIARTYGSFQLAFIYVHTIDEYRKKVKREPSKKELEATAINMLPDVNDGADAQYWYTTFGVLDEMVRRGYKIDFVLEEGIGDMYYKDNMVSEVGTTKTVVQVREWLEKHKADDLLRNKGMARQITGIIAGSSLPTNIYVQCGTLHSGEKSGIQAFLPESLGSFVTVNATRPEGLLNDATWKIMEGEDVTDDEVMAFRKRWNT